MSFFKKIKIKELEKSPVPVKKEEPIEEKKEKDLFDSDGQLTIDVFETNSDFVVLSAIAGISAKNVDISVEKDMLIIKGQRQNPQDPKGDPKGKNYFYQECYWGPFSRKILLPENVDVSRIDAKLTNGILTVKFPKVEKA